MQVEAIYDHGWLQLLPGVNVKRSRIRLTVIIPDHKTVPEATTQADPFPEDSYSSGGDSKGAPQPRRSVREAVKEILGSWKRTIVSGLPPSDEEHDRLRDERW
ncbi:hypothetical protein CAP2UW1_3252 [Candidatus Accumulibacter phosphatis]|uniref:Uncharacterized protein n=1 Tax=Accumulibacter regalis TaxID=522306 RepID=C7RIE6_ACCRE